MHNGKQFKVIINNHVFRTNITDIFFYYYHPVNEILMNLVKKNKIKNLNSQRDIILHFNKWQFLLKQKLDCILLYLFFNIIIKKTTTTLLKKCILTSIYCAFLKVFFFIFYSTRFFLSRWICCRLVIKMQSY